MFQRFARALVGALLATGLGIAATPAWAGGHEPTVVIFGDSLSDTGNKLAVTGQLSTPPYADLDAFRIPEYPYVRSERFTNGPTWIEGAALAGRFANSVRAVLSARRPGHNYAYGGARAGAPLVPSDDRNLTDQVTSYLADVNGTTNADTIVLFIGANDVADAVRALAIDPSGATSVNGLIAGLESINDNLTRLVEAGAHHFVILNVPNLALVPALNPPLAPPGLAGIATCWTAFFDHGTPLPAGCPQLPPGMPGLDAIAAGIRVPGSVRVRLFDTFTFINQIAAHPEKYGITNIKDTCVTPNVAPYQCARPNKYFFWDGIHPTEVVHQLLANAVAQQI